MGKRILVRRRGKGGIQFRARTLHRIAPVAYPSVPNGGSVSGTVTRLVHDAGHTAPLAQVRLDNGDFAYLPAVVGLQIGSRIHVGAQARAALGNVLPLHQISEGTVVCNIEGTYGDGGKFVRASGGSATVLSRTPSGVTLKLPSGKTILLNGQCRATVGEIAGGGRTEKPFLKAGTKYHLMRARGRLYPRVRGIAMAAVYHPFGGGRHQHPGKSTSTSRLAPPGRKVGLIAPRKTGRGGKAGRQSRRGRG